ncbi:hypothetical protein ACLOJK_016458 [Asimina triloba]
MDHQPSLQLQLEDSRYARLSKEVAEKNQQLRQMRGEDIQTLTLEELQKLEKTLEAGLSHVLEQKFCNFQAGPLISLSAPPNASLTPCGWSCIQASRMVMHPSLLHDRSTLFHEHAVVEVFVDCLHAYKKYSEMEVPENRYIGACSSFVVVYFCIWIFAQIEEMSKSEKQMMDSEVVVNEDGQSSDTITNGSNSGGPPDYDDSSDTSLKLGSVKMF